MSGTSQSVVLDEVSRATYGQCESTSALGIDEEQGWDGEDDLDCAVSERCVQGFGESVTGLFEDR